MSSITEPEPWAGRADFPRNHPVLFPIATKKGRGPSPSGPVSRIGARVPSTECLPNASRRSPALLSRRLHPLVSSVEYLPVSHSSTGAFQHVCSDRSDIESPRWCPPNHGGGNRPTIDREEKGAIRHNNRERGPGKLTFEGVPAASEQAMTHFALSHNLKSTSDGSLSARRRSGGGIRAIRLRPN